MACSFGTNAPFSILFSKVFKTLLKLLLIIESLDCLKVGIAILVGAFHIIMCSFRIVMCSFHIIMG